MNQAVQAQADRGIADAVLGRHLLQGAGGQEKADPYVSLVKRLAVDDKLDFDTAKILIAAYREAQKKMEVE